jgi:S1-C subfamily serine protease
MVAAKLQTTSSVQEELEVGDVVVGINGKSALGISSLQELLSGLPEDSPLVARVQRDGIMRYLLIRGD